MEKTVDFKKIFENAGNQIGESLKTLDMSPSLMEDIYCSGDKGISAASAMLESSHMMKILKSKSTVYSLSIKHKTLTKPSEDFISILNENGFKLVFENHFLGQDWEDINDSSSTDKVSRLYIKDNTSLNVNIRKVRETISISIDILTDQKDIILKFKKILNDFCEDSPESNDLYIIVKDGAGGYYLRTIGRPAVEFSSDNYSEEVCKDFEFISKQLNSKSPKGRLVILHGEAGTGKTYMLRSLMKECTAKKAKIIYFQASLFNTLSPLDIIQLFLSESQDSSSSTILFIEDGDEALLKRSSQNINIISTLLNFADGLIGNLLDIKIVVTTNVEADDMDSALKRPGRLCKKVNIGKLSSTKCLNLYKKLSGKDPSEKVITRFKQGSTLATVYQEVSNE